MLNSQKEPHVVWKDGVRYVLDDDLADPLAHILREVRDIKREQKVIRLEIRDLAERMKALAEAL